MILGIGLLQACQTDKVEQQDNTPKTVTSDDRLENLPYYRSATFDPLWEPELEGFHQIKDFNFTDQNGEGVTGETFENKVYLTNFFFTSCSSICPRMIRNMEYVQNQLKDKPEVMFLSHSVMPEMDTVDKLKSYTQNYAVDDSRWKFVTGNKAEIYDMARKAYFAEEEIGFNKDSTEFLHTEHFILVDQQKHIRGIYNGTIRLEMDRIVDDILLLLEEE